MATTTTTTDVSTTDITELEEQSASQFGNGSNFTGLEFYFDPSGLEFLAQVIKAFQICFPVEVVLGSIGNFIAFAVLWRKSYRKSSTAVYLRALALFDIGTLFISAIFTAVYNDMEFYVPKHKEVCFIVDFFLIMFIDMSNWSLVLVTLERLLAILLPHRVSQIMTKRFAHRAFIALTVFMVLTNCQDLIMIEEASWDRCQIGYNTEPQRTISRVFIIIHFCKFFALPLPFISISNIIIVVHLRRQASFFQKATDTTNRKPKKSKSRSFKTSTKKDGQSQYEKSSFNLESSTNERASQNPSVDVGCVNAHQQQQENNKETTPKTDTAADVSMNSRKQRDRSLMVTLVALNVVFILTRLPFEINLIIFGFPPSDIVTPTEFGWKIVVVLISLVNNSINVFLYFLAGSRFKREFKAMIFELCGKKVDPSQF